MKKKEFLERLKLRLSLLQKDELKDILDEYENHIKEKMKDGKTEEEAIKDFGDVDQLADEILSAYKIDINSSKQRSTKNTLDVIIDEIVEFVKKIGEAFNGKTGEDLVRIICKAVLILIMVAILQLPFSLIAHLGESIFDGMFNAFYLGTIIGSIWSFIIQVLYFIVSIYIIYIAVKRMIFEDLDLEKREVNKMEKDKKDDDVNIKKKDKKDDDVNIKKKDKTEEHDNRQKKEKKIEYADDKKTDSKIVYKDDIKNNSNEKIEYTDSKNTNPTDVIGYVLMLIVKIFACFMLIPTVMVLVGLVIFFGLMIAAAIEGIYLISLFFIIGGLIIVSSSVVGGLSHLIAKKEVK